MLDSLNSKKTKITLADYNYQKDIENRLLIAQFKATDLKILEEIIFGPIKMSIEELCQSTEIEREELLKILSKLSRTNLLSLQGDTILIDKEMRKYYETQIIKFDEDFKPGMDYFQHLLKKVPIHVLPTWYAIPRTSNNIFDSIVEKYLSTPQVFHRYLTELSFTDPNTQKIMDMVYLSDDFQIPSLEVMETLHLTKEQFAEHMLLLEFSCLCCLTHQKVGGEWEEMVVPFQEWKDYLLFLKNSEVRPIQNIAAIDKELPEDFSFVKDMGLILQSAKKKPLSLQNDENLISDLFSKTELSSKSPEFLKSYLKRLINKLISLQLCDTSSGALQAAESADYFLEMKPEARALFIYRHPLNRFMMPRSTTPQPVEKTIRDCEKSIVRALGKGWVFFEDFLKGVLAAIDENTAVTLKKTGKTWRYALPDYLPEDKEFIHYCILDWLVEVGITAKGSYAGKECFTVTAFGSTLFSR